MNSKTHIQYGLIISAIVILFSTLFYILHINTQKWTQWVGVLIMFVGVILSCIQFAKANDGNVTFGNVFGNGFKTTAIVALVTIAFSVLFVLIFPDIKQQALEQVRLDMEKQGQADDVIDKAVAMTDKMFIVFMLAGGIFGTLFFGVIASLIGAAVAKKNPNTRAI
jgi:Protein of unknown function (DUF4199)